MSAWLFLLLMAGSVIPLGQAVRRQWREDPSGFFLSIGLLGLYFVYCGVGAFIAIWAVPPPPAPEIGAVMLTGFAVTWIGYGALWLYRLAPDYRNGPDAALKKFGWLDIFVLIALGFLLSAVQPGNLALWMFA